MDREREVSTSRSLAREMNHSRRAFLWRSAGFAAPLLLSPRRLWAAEVRAELNVRDHGAKGDRHAIDTRAIQAAIDAAGRSGRTVYFPPGEYLSGTLHLRSHTTLRLEAGATLVASPDDADFDPVEHLDHDSSSDRETTDFRFALLQGQDLTDVSILGPGRIDGNRAKRGGPKPIALKQCRNIRIAALTIINAPNYNISLLGCARVEIVGVTILNGYSDGIDPDCCQDVRITNCHIDSRDDAIVLKTSFALGRRRATQDVTVTNCYLTTVHNALKLGTETTGDFRNIVFSNCTIVARSHAWKGEPELRRLDRNGGWGQRRARRGFGYPDDQRSGAHLRPAGQARPRAGSTHARHPEEHLDLERGGRRRDDGFVHHGHTRPPGGRDCPEEHLGHRQRRRQS